MRFIIFTLAFIISETNAAELEPIIYSSKQDSTESDLSSSLEVIEAQTLVRKNEPRLADQLRVGSSLEVNQTGVTGGQASVFIRGLEGRHTAFAIDGVRIFDAASIQRILNPAIINSSQIERIEILKGAQSVLYGSDAIGGVVNIITKKSAAKNVLTLETGIFNNFELAHNVVKGESLISLNAFYQEDLDQNDLRIGSELDKKFNKGISIGFLTTIGRIESDSEFKLQSDFSETDGQDFSTDLPFDAAGYYSDVRNFLFSQKLTKDEGNNRKFQLDLSANRSERTNVSPTSELFFRGDVFQSELKWIGEELLFGAQYVEEKYTDDEIDNHELSNFDLFSNYQKKISSYVAELGARATSNRYYGNHMIYNVGLTKILSNTQTLTLSQKTGFKAPSSYQLFGETSFGSVGNKDLAPEKSQGLELTHKYKKEGLMTEVSIFQNKVENFIGFEDNQYENIEGAFYQGVELTVSQTFKRVRASLNANLTGHHLSSGEEVERRASERFKINLGYELSETESINLNYRYKGSRFEDIDGRLEILSAYDVLDLNFNKVTKKFDYSLSVKNIFDEKYEEAYLYATQRFGVQGRISYRY